MLYSPECLLEDVRIFLLWGRDKSPCTETLIEVGFVKIDTTLGATRDSDSSFNSATGLSVLEEEGSEISAEQMLRTNPIVLCRQWADWRKGLCEATILLVPNHRCSESIFSPPLHCNGPRANAFVPVNIGCPLSPRWIIIFSAELLHKSCGPGGPLFLSSFSEDWPMSFSFFLCVRLYSWTIRKSFFSFRLIQSMSLHVVMKMIPSSNFSGWFLLSSIVLWISRSNCSVESWEIFHPNTTGSPSNQSNSRYSPDFANQWMFSFQASVDRAYSRILPPTKYRIRENVYTCFRQLDGSFVWQSSSRPWNFIPVDIPNMSSLWSLISFCEMSNNCSILSKSVFLVVRTVSW